ncbi:unnamed protein product, partial [Didymodactylos carnosus]
GFDGILVGIDDWDEMQEFESFWMDDISMFFDDDDDDVVFVEECRGEWCEFKEDRGDDNDVIFMEERCGSGSILYEGALKTELENVCGGGEDGLIFMEECVSMNV